ncbi:MAG: glycosyltransferase [Anaerolineae bacterium]|nr:glycosyltransferase [Anaerolineae bacterium]
MNILFLSTWFPFPPDNGSKIRAHYLLRALAERHQVSLVAFNPDANTDFDVPENVTAYPVRADPFRYVQLPQLVKYLSPLPLVFLRSAEMEEVTKQLPNQALWDAIVAIQAPVARYALRFCIPRVLDVDTALSYQLRQHYEAQTTRLGRWRAWVSWYKAYRYENALFPRFQVCTVVSPTEVASVQAMTGTRSTVAVIPNGVDCTHHRPGLVEVEPNTLVYNGALTYSANYDAMRYFLVDIYSLIKQQIPDVSIRITGSTKGVDLSGLQLDESVNLTGYVEDIRLLVAGSAVCVVPLRQGGGTRLKILEAMALGTSVVATSKGAEGLGVVDGEHLLIADDPAAFAQATVCLLREDALRARLAANARRLVEERYDWAHIGARFVELVENAYHKGHEGHEG